jgi:6-phosphogluconolactonase
MSKDGPGGRASIEVFGDRESLALGTANILAAALGQGLARSGRASLAAAGGATPAPVYRRLAAARLDWGGIAVVPTDERWVDPSSPDSNEAMLRQTLLTGPAGSARLVSLWSDAASPDDAARAAEPKVRALLPFDAVLMGMGEDGHVASLFPASPILQNGLDPDGARLVLAAPAGEPAPPQARISLTLAALLRARGIVVLTTGTAKRRTLEEALAGAALPVRSVLAQDRVPVRVLWSP